MSALLGNTKTALSAYCKKQAENKQIHPLLDKFAVEQYKKLYDDLAQHKLTSAEFEERQLQLAIAIYELDQGPYGRQATEEKHREEMLKLGIVVPAFRVPLKHNMLYLIASKSAVSQPTKPNTGSHANAPGAPCA
jgi:hypothetical protein